MKIKNLLMGVVAINTAVAFNSASATVYKIVDPATGHVTYTNKQPGADETSTNAPSVPETKVKQVHIKTSVAPANFPVASSAEQKQRDSDRVQILADEIANESKELADAKSKHATPEDIHRHEANLAALDRELKRMRPEGVTK